MLECSSETGLRLSYNAGVLDGMMIAAGIVAGCKNDQECKNRMVASLHEVVQQIAQKRCRLLTCLLIDDLS